MRYSGHLGPAFRKTACRAREFTVALAGDRYSGIGLSADILAHAALQAGYAVRRCEAHELPHSAAVSLALVAISSCGASRMHGYRGANLLIAGGYQQAEQLAWLVRSRGTVEYVGRQPIHCAAGQEPVEYPSNTASWWPLTERLAIAAATTGLSQTVLKLAFEKHLPRRGQEPAWDAFSAAYERWASA